MRAVLLFFCWMTCTCTCHCHFNSSCISGCRCSSCNEQEETLNIHCSFARPHSEWLQNRICSLNLANSAIVSIERWKFGNLTRLKNMSLSKNSITTLPGNTFVNLTSLKHLYLDSNRIKTIQHNAFRGLGDLEDLFLDHNELDSLAQGVFQGLHSLRYLGLRYNKLTTWHSILSIELPRLTHLNIGGNPDLKLTETLLVNSSVKTISGAMISKACASCQLQRANVSRKTLLPRRKCQYVPQKYSHMLEQYERRFVLFKGQCGSTRCELSLTDIDPIRKIYVDMCWAKVRDIRAVEYAFGSTAILLNICVVVGTLSSRSLRSKISFALVAHLAFCDLLIGVYSICVATGHGFNNDASFREWRVTHCPYYRTIYVLGQTMGVVTASLMTVDRYLAVVHYMKPSLRINLKTASLTLGLSWFGTGIFCCLIQLVDHPVIRDNFMCILVQNISLSKRLYFTQVQMLLCVALYIAVIIMYARIYAFVKRSSEKAKARRETKLAVRIAVIVLSNVVFFVVPNTLFVAFTAGMLNVSTKPVTNALVRIWSAPVFMTVSACVNPILFAFRNESFTRNIKRPLTRSFSPKADVATDPGLRQLGMGNEDGRQSVSPVTIELRIR